MKWRPTAPEPFASPSGWASEAERSSNAAELTAPAHSANTSAENVTGWPSTVASTCVTRCPEASVTIRVTSALVTRSTLPKAAAGSTDAISASHLRWSRSGKPSNAARPMASNVSRSTNDPVPGFSWLIFTPIGSSNARTPCARRPSATSAMRGEWARGGCGYGPAGGSNGSAPRRPWTW